MDKINKIEIKANECIICRHSKNFGESDKSQFTTPELENCLLELFHIDPSNINTAKIENQALTGNGVSGENSAQIIAESYCPECSKRNHDIYNFAAEIRRLNLMLTELKETVKMDFVNSFRLIAHPIESEVNGCSVEILRNKYVRYEIAVAIGLNLSGDEEEDSCVDAYGYSDDEEGPPEVLEIEIESDPEILAKELKPWPWDWDQLKPGSSKENLEQKCGKKLSEAELKKLYKLKDVSIAVERLSTEIIGGGTVNVNLQENQLKQRTLRRRRKSAVAPMIVDLADEAEPLSPAYSPEDHSEHSSEDEFCEESSENPRTPAPKSRRRKSRNPDEPEIRCEVEGCARIMPFRTQEDLEIHRKRVHEGIDKPFKCPNCESYYVNRTTRRRHIEYIHLKLPNHVCDVCGKKCFDQAHLNVHKTTHNADRPAQCPECGQGFKIERYMKIHLRRVHRNERPHSCDRCGKCFHTAWKLKTHIQRVHFKHETPYICELCGKGFAVQGNLYMHMRLNHKPKTEEEERREDADPAGAKIKRRRTRKPKPPPKEADSSAIIESVNVVTKDCSHLQESAGSNNPSTSSPLDEKATVPAEAGYPILHNLFMRRDQQ